MAPDILQQPNSILPLSHCIKRSLSGDRVLKSNSSLVYIPIYLYLTFIINLHALECKFILIGVCFVHCSAP